MNAVMRRLFVSGFARSLRRVTELAPDRVELERAIARLPNHHKMAGGDRQARFNLLVARSLQAAVAHLEDHGLRRPEAVALARQAFLENGTAVLRAVFAVWLNGTSDPVARMQARRGLAARALKLWGKGFQIHEATGSEHVALHVTRCPFADYFWNVSEPDLTPILCAYEAQWMAQVNASKGPLTVKRRGTMVSGSEQCAFTFVRVEKEPAKPKGRACWGKIGG